MNDSRLKRWHLGRKQMEQASNRMKFCPKCGSANVFWASGLPQLWSLWECRECGYRGTLIVEDSKLAAKLRKKWKKNSQEQMQSK